MNTKFKVVLFVSVVLAALVLAPAAQALPLTARDTVLNPADGFPVWYQDSNGMSLGQCLDSVIFCGLLADATFNPANPLAFPLNYPGEQFYFLAEVLTGPPYNLLYVAATEGSFAGAGNPVNGQQAVFSRVRIRADITLPGTYTVTHPYGTETFNVAAGGTRAINFSNDVLGLVALSFDGPLDVNPLSAPLVGPYLRASAAPGGAPLAFVEDAVTGNKYLSNPGAPVAVTGAPTGNNLVTITGPDGTVTETLFTLVGKVIGNDVTPKSLTFAPQRTVVASPVQTVTVTNISRVATLTLGPITITGANAADFTLAADTCSNATVPASTATVPGTCTFGVVFSSNAPTPAARTATATVNTVTPAGLPPMNVALSGTIDSVAPTVITSFPAAGQTIPANSTITVNFSEPMAAASINATTFTLTGGAGAVSGTVLYDAVNNAATFIPSALNANAAYTATVTTGATDVAGNGLAADFVLSFTTVPPDFDRPTIVSTNPPANRVGVPVSATIKVTFNEQMHAGSFTANTFTVSGGVVASSISYDVATNTATFTPASPLVSGTPYTATIKGGPGGVDDLAQNTLANDYQFTFITNNPPAHPALISPSNGSTGHPTSVTLVWSRSSDDDGDVLDYQITVCNNQFFIGCTAQAVPVTAAAPRLNGAYFAGLGGLGMAVFGLVSVSGVKGRKRFLSIMLVVLLMSGVVISACSSSDGGGTPAPRSAEVSYTASGLSVGTLYYWRVQVSDPNGGTDFSETWSFRTQ